MTDETTEAPGLWARAKVELLEYLAISAYVALFLGALLNYRRIVLAEVGIPYARYGYAIVEALVLGKVILVGDALRLGRDRDRGDRLLIVSALHRSVFFSLFVLVFHVIEHVVLGLAKHEPLEAEVPRALASPSMIAAHVLLVLLAFIPFFLLREAGRHLGEERFLALLLRRGRAPGAGAARAHREAAGGEPPR